MAAKTSFRLFRRCLGKHLAPLGFKAYGELMALELSQAVIVLEPQKHHERPCVTINIGIALRALIDKNEESYPPAVDKCHWRNRLAHDMDVGTDGWWTLRDDMEAEDLCFRIATGLANITLPTLLARANPETFISSWSKGRSEGLTEYERRSNLARLLISLGRLEESAVAMQALSAASIDKAWRGTTKVELAEMEKKLAAKGR
jgi:hypothetical protein